MTELDPEDLLLDPTARDGREISPAMLTHAAAEDQLTLRELEVQYIDEIMRITGGNKVHAAKILGVDRKTLYRRAERRNRQSSKTQS